MSEPAITIRKKDARGTLFLFPSWISNGHWMVRKEFVKNAQQLEDDPLKVVGAHNGMVRREKSDNPTRIARRGCRRWRPWLLGGTTNYGGRQCVVLGRGSADSVCYIDSRYWNLLSPIAADAAIVGDGPNSPVALINRRGSALAVVMPIRGPGGRIS